MSVLIISKNDMSVIQLANVSNIAFASGNAAVTASGTTTTYNLNDYNISLLW